MKIKNEIAYEPQSSETRRTTPEDLGLLLAKATPEQLTQILASMLTELETYSTSNRQWGIRQVLHDVGVHQPRRNHYE